MTGHSGSGGRSVRRFLNEARPEDPRGRVRRDREPRASALERSSTPLCVRLRRRRADRLKKSVQLFFQGIRCDSYLFDVLDLFQNLH